MPHVFRKPRSLEAHGLEREPADEQNLEKAVWDAIPWRGLGPLLAEEPAALSALIHVPILAWDAGLSRWGGAAIDRKGERLEAFVDRAMQRAYLKFTRPLPEGTDEIFWHGPMSLRPPR